jgi:hypothetical protein
MYPVQSIWDRKRRIRSLQVANFLYAFGITVRRRCGWLDRRTGAALCWWGKHACRDLKQIAGYHIKLANIHCLQSIASITITSGWHDVNNQHVKMCEFLGGNEPLHCVIVLAHFMYSRTARLISGCPDHSAFQTTDVWNRSGAVHKPQRSTVPLDDRWASSAHHASTSGRLTRQAGAANTSTRAHATCALQTAIAGFGTASPYLHSASDRL